MHFMALEMQYVRGLIYAANQSKKSIQTLCTFLATTLCTLYKFGAVEGREGKIYMQPLLFSVF
jgi:hypothetical protein